MQTPTRPLDLDALLDEAEAAAEARAEEQARQAREREHQDLRNDRRAAAALVRDRLNIDTAPTDWERLEADEGFRSRAVILPFPDRPEIALAARQRSYTQGGPILTVLAQTAGDVWVGSSREVDALADLGAVVDDAVDRAERWDEDEAALDDETETHDPEPRLRIEGDTLGEILEAVIAAIGGAAAITSDSV